MLDTFPLASFHTQPSLSHSLFSNIYSENSIWYRQWGQFSYDLHHCTTDHIHACIKVINDNNSEWVYVGEVKQGTDHIPHGIGIKVWKKGDTQQLKNKVVEEMSIKIN